MSIPAFFRLTINEYSASVETTLSSWTQQINLFGVCEIVFLGTALIVTRVPSKYVSFPPTTSPYFAPKTYAETYLGYVDFSDLSEPQENGICYKIGK